MAEYIERSEAIEFIKHNTPNINGETTVKCVIRSLKNVPTADVAEIVRCKDCKYFVTNGIEPSFCEYHTDNVGYCDEACWVDENDFCSYGAKMDGEGE